MTAMRGATISAPVRRPAVAGASTQPSAGPLAISSTALLAAAGYAPDATTGAAGRAASGCSSRTPG